MEITICNLGKISYDEALKLQYKIVEARQQNIIGNVLLLLEHPPVLTKGTRTDAANIYLSEKELDKLGMSVYEVNRGGDVTYHGPGQIVGYPIVQLKDFDEGIRWFIHTLETALISVLKENFNIDAYPRKDKFTGVWVGDKKIAAFGLAVTHGVTMHGFAFNVNTNLEHFNVINPCGLSMGVTSVANELSSEVDFEDTTDLVGESIARSFGWDANYIDYSTLKSLISNE